MMMASGLNHNYSHSSHENIYRATLAFLPMFDVNSPVAKYQKIRGQHCDCYVLTFSLEWLSTTTKKTSTHPSQDHTPYDLSSQLSFPHGGAYLDRQLHTLSRAHRQPHTCNTKHLTPTPIASNNSSKSSGRTHIPQNVLTNPNQTVWLIAISNIHTNTLPEAQAPYLFQILMPIRLPS